MRMDESDLRYLGKYLIGPTVPDKSHWGLA